MINTTTYFFSVVTFIPHPIRDERINLGIVVVSEDSTEYGCRFSTQVREKLRVLAPDVHFSAVTRWVDDFTKRFVRWSPDVVPIDALEPSRATLEYLASLQGGQVRLSPPRAVTSSAGTTSLVRSLFNDYVGHLQGVRAPAVGRPQIRKAIRRALREWSIPDTQIVQEPIIPGRHGDNRLDLGVLGTNGKTAKVLVAMEPISFRIASAVDIIQQRDHVAWVGSDLELADSAPSLCAVVTSPAPDHTALYEQSRRLFEEVNVKVVEDSNIDALRDLLSARGTV